MDCLDGPQVFCVCAVSGTSGNRFLVTRGVDFYLCVFLIVSTFCCTAPMEVMAVWFSWPPLEVGVGYLAGASCLGMSVDTGFLGELDSIVRQFSNIFRIAAIADNCESQILVVTSLSATDKKCMAWAVLYYAVTCGCVRYSCKYLALSVIINALVLLSIAWMQW